MKTNHFFQFIQIYFTDVGIAVLLQIGARYYHQTGIDSEWETNPLVKLGEKLMQEHAMLDFHKIVLDTDYRKSLWKRP